MFWLLVTMKPLQILKQFETKSGKKKATSKNY